jgi:hypothetical protein
MNKFNPKKLTVAYRNGVSATNPIIPRAHTLTHSDLSGDLLLTIGTHFALDNINTKLRDEVIGFWKMNGYSLYYNVYLLLDIEEHDLNVAIRRNEVFRRELPLALTAIRYGDRFLFELNPNLDIALIHVNFLSIYPQLCKQESWGDFSCFSI